MSDLSLEDRIKTLEQQLRKSIDLSEQLVTALEDAIDNIHSDINSLWRETPKLTGAVSPDSTAFSSPLFEEIYTSIDNLKREIQSPDE